MPLFEWKDELSVKVAELDRQHQKLIDMINELNDAMRLGKGNDVMKKTLSGLVGYSLTHFKLEEKYFDQLGYPDSATHRAKHAEFVQKISEFQKGFETGKLTMSIHVMAFLKDWLLNHIKVTDQKYSAHFNSKGLK